MECWLYAWRAPAPSAAHTPPTRVYTPTDYHRHKNISTDQIYFFNFKYHTKFLQMNIKQLMIEKKT